MEVPMDMLEHCGYAPFAQNTKEIHHFPFRNFIRTEKRKWRAGNVLHGRKEIKR